MHTAVALFDIGAVFNFIHSGSISPEWKNSVKSEQLKRSLPATKQPPHIEKVLMLQLRLGDLCTRLWFSIAPQLTVNMLFDTTFIERFIRAIFSSDCKVVPWHSPPVTILTNPEPGYNVNGTQDTQEDHENMAEGSEKMSVIRVARQIVSKNTQHYLMITTNAFGFKTIEPLTMLTSRQSTLEAQESMDIEPNRLI